MTTKTKKTKKQPCAGCGGDAIRIEVEVLLNGNSYLGRYAGALPKLPSMKPGELTAAIRQLADNLDAAASMDPSDAYSIGQKITDFAEFKSRKSSKKTPPKPSTN